MRRIAFLLLLFCAAAAAVSAQPGKSVTPIRPPKVYISVDLEGINGVIGNDQLSSQGSDYNRARKLMVEEVNRAIEGALAAGSTEILVNDAHGSQRNLILEDLKPPARLVSNYFKAAGMMEGLDQLFAAVYFIGFHARAGSPVGVLAHTGSGALRDVLVNGKRVGEGGLNILYAASLNVPVVLITGDQEAIAQARELVPNLEAVEVKQALGTRAAIFRPLEEVRAEIRQASERALRKRFDVTIPQMKPPFIFEVTFSNTALADIAEQIPTVKRTGSHTVSYATDDYRAGYRLLRVLYRYMTAEQPISGAAERLPVATRGL
jgi:D-amino peptidase